MKISDLQAKVARHEEAVTVTIYQEDGDPYLAADGTESTISVVGSESDQYKAAVRQGHRRAVKRARGGGMADDAKLAEIEQVRQSAAAVVAWHGWEDEAGNPWPCTPDNVRALLSITHIHDQVHRAINNHASFFELRSGN